MKIENSVKKNIFKNVNNFTLNGPPDMGVIKHMN